MSLATATSTQKIGIFIPKIDIPPGDNRAEEIIDRIEYLLQNGGNAVGVQREVNVIIPEIESLLKELKKAIREERKTMKVQEVKNKH